MKTTGQVARTVAWFKNFAFAAVAILERILPR
jgi:hypothetical protein